MDIEVEIGGKLYSGSYDSGGNMISVYYEGEHRSTQVDGAARDIEAFAKQILRSLIRSTIAKDST
jgi:hypothetical protein